MFERYTERARRVIFFARYEASQYGCQYIETEHLLLGVMREDKGLMAHLGITYHTQEGIRKSIESRGPQGEKVSVSVDMPLSDSAKRVLAYAAEESGRLAESSITPAHLFLGLMRETTMVAAGILKEHGFDDAEQVREMLTRGQTQHSPPAARRDSPMFEKYVENARRVIFVARTEALESGSEAIDSEHLLLAIVREDPALAAHLSLPLEASIRSYLSVKPRTAGQADLPLTLAAKTALQRAAEEAERLGHRHIAPIHLLMGLLKDEESLACELLNSHGVTLSQVEQLSSQQSATGALPPPPPSADAAMIQIITGFWVSRAVCTAARLGIADLVKDGPKAAEELARSTGSNPDSLYRMMRALASVGVFAELPGRRFATTPVAATLEERPGSMRYFAMTELGQEHFSAWEEFEHSVRTGGLAFTERFKQPVWEYYAKHPDHAEVFNLSMSTLTEWVTQAILAVYDFTPFSKIVDIGGGQGAFLAAMLGKAPGARGVLFDAPAVIAETTRLRDAGLLDRSEQVAGNFFAAVPEGGDLYTMKMILHDWNDDECHSILSNIRKVIGLGGKVVIVETVLGPGPDAPFKNFLDLNMMVMTGGRERTEADYRTLLEKAGFQLTRVLPTTSPMSIVEGVAVTLG